MKKGFWRTFESVLAVIVLVFFMLLIGARYTVPGEGKDMSRTGYDILRGMDVRGELRSYVVNNQTGELESDIIIPGHSHAVQICGPDGCYGKEAGGTNVWVSAYIISGESEYDPHEVKLLIW